MNHKLLLSLIVILFLALLGTGIHKKAFSAAAPPIYDPISYYAKSQLVWRAISEKSFHKAMTWLAVRPPGSALILYPTGFKPSIYSYLFRSVFAPIAIWSVALIVLLLPLIRHRRDALLGAAFIAGLMSMPLFYQFQPSDFFREVYGDGSFWGLVDALIGAVGALGLGLIYNGIKKSSLTLCSAGWFLGAFSIYIKPSGILVMAVLFGVAAVELLIRYVNAEIEQRRSILKYGLAVYAIGFAFFGVAYGVAIHTDYLNAKAIETGKYAQSVCIHIFGEVTFRRFLSMLYIFIRPIIGWWWFCPIVLAFILLVASAVRRLFMRRFSENGLRLLAAIVAAAVILWWWVYLASPQHRYVFPFILMLIAWFVPVVFSGICRLRKGFQVLTAVYCLIPVLMLAVMLQTKHPNVDLQQVLGVNLTTDQYGDEVKWGQWLISQANEHGKPLNLYSIGDGVRVGIIEMAGWIDSIEHKNRFMPLFVKRPVYFNHEPPGLRLEDLVHSDYLIMEYKTTTSAMVFLPTSVRHQNQSDAVEISDWQQESLQFMHYIYGNYNMSENGLEVVSGGPLVLLRVADSQKFEKTILEWVRSVRWKNDFLERNKNFLKERQFSQGT